MRFVKIDLKKLNKKMKNFLGSFAPYEPVFELNAPEQYGFAGGVFYEDNSTEYVGYGNFPGSPCSGQSPAPGFILTKPSKPGIYMSCFPGNQYSDQTAIYLYNHPLLRWVPTNNVAMMTDPASLKISGNVWAFLFGRVLYNGFYHVGKIDGTSNVLTLWVTTSTGERSFNTGIEVLACGN